MTVPGLIEPARIAAMVSGSESNTRAVPLKVPLSSVLPDSFKRQLSGAILPLSTLICRFGGAIGFDTGETMS